VETGSGNLEGDNMGNSESSIEKLTHKFALSLADAGQLASAGKNQLYLAISRGELRAVKRGRSTLILPDDLRAWLNGLPAFSAETKYLSQPNPPGQPTNAQRRTSAKARRANVEARSAAR
jgi:hypothetical protein